MTSVQFAIDLANLFGSENVFDLSQDDNARVSLWLPISNCHINASIIQVSTTRSRFSDRRKTQAICSKNYKFTEYLRMKGNLDSMICGCKEETI